jgi:O-antigen ligase
MSTYAPSSTPASPTRRLPRIPLRVPSDRGASDAGELRRSPLPALGAALLTAAVICFATFTGEGGLQEGQASTVQIVLTLLAGIAVAAAIVLAPPRAPLRGLWPIALLLAFTAVTAASISWSVAPNTSWQEAAMMFAYSGVFIAAAAVARSARALCDGVLAGIALAATIVSVYALLTKVFPGEVGPLDPYARLIGAFGYWNATGLAAGMGIVACMWLGSRRAGHALLRALAYPATGLLMVTLMLSYSRGALAMTVVGIVVWLCIVPLRLRATTMLIAAGACAGGVIGFAFAKPSLSGEEIELAARASGGHELGVLLIAMALVLLAIGVVVNFATDRRAPSAIARRRAGAALIAAVALAVIAAIGGLAASQRGLTGTISHDVSSLTNPNAPVPANTPNRLTAASSVRARYWKEAIEVFEAHPALGAGAGGYAVASLRFKPPDLEAKNAHGYIVQTLADLGIVGVAITLLLLIAWAAAAGSATHPFNRRWRRGRWEHAPTPYTPERIALLSMLCVVIVFGLHSLVDWTWYVPGTACAALICAGWLVGRGELLTAVDGGPARWRHLVPGRVSNLRLAGALAAVLLALLAAWVEWQPQLAYEEAQTSLALIETSPHRALAEAEGAVARDPLSAEALASLATAQQSLGRRSAATATLQRAVRMQPANPETWANLGFLDLEEGRSKAAISELGAAVYLNPQKASYQDGYVRALRDAATAKRHRARS